MGLQIACRFRKAGRVWCAGARETREPHVTIGRTVNKSETTKNLPAFQDLNDISKNMIKNLGKFMIFKTQSLIASDSMSIANGSTEVVPCSHLLENLDVALHNKDIYNSFEPFFMNVTLNQVNEKSRTSDFYNKLSLLNLN